MDNGKIVVQHIAMKKMPADLLTKMLAKSRVKYLRDMFGLGPISAVSSGGSVEGME
jgi:hypothetical protein